MEEKKEVENEGIMFEWKQKRQNIVSVKCKTSTQASYSFFTLLQFCKRRYYRGEICDSSPRSSEEAGFTGNHLEPSWELGIMTLPVLLCRDPAVLFLFVSSVGIMTTVLVSSSLHDKEIF